MIKPDQLEAFGFTGANPLWDALLAHLDECMQDDIASAISRETLGENRTHAAGRAEAMNDFLVSLHQLREEAVSRRGSIG